MLFAGKIQAQEKNSFVYEPNGKKDPFIPLVSADGRILEPRLNRDREGELRLEGIIYDSGGSSYAVINGNIIRAGEAVEDARVLRIESRKVIFQKSGREFELELKKEE